MSKGLKFYGIVTHGIPKLRIHTLSPIIMEVENGCILNVATVGGTVAGTHSLLP